jgi:hypothetical protein
MTFPVQSGITVKSEINILFIEDSRRILTPQGGPFAV